jgi:CRP-like cAMP-binding protein
VGSPETKLWYLENFNLFRDLTKEDMQELAERTTMQEPPKDEYIYFPPDPSSSLFFLKKGRVKIGTYSDDGEEIIKAILEPGEIFGELGLGEEQDSYEEFAQVMDDNGVICTMNKEDLEELMRKNPKLSLQITKFIGFRLKRVERKLESLIFKDARTRIIDLLKEMAEQRGTKVGVETKVDNILTHKEMAKLSATSRQTVTTVLNELKRKNLIYFDRKKILIRDLNKLK